MEETHSDSEMDEKEQSETKGKKRKLKRMQKQEEGRKSKNIIPKVVDETHDSLKLKRQQNPTKKVMEMESKPEKKKFKKEERISTQ